MKKHLIFLALAMVASTPAYASFTVPGIGTCGGGTCPAGATFRNNTVIGCGSATTCYCIGLENDLLSGELACEPCTTDSDCAYGYGCINGECKLCTSCSNCTSSTTWDNYGTGCQRQTQKKCNCNGTCTTSYKYRGTQGYYTAGTTSCQRCPALNGVYGTTAGTGATLITACYIPSTETFTFTDSNGSGTKHFSTDCYYTN